MNIAIGADHRGREIAAQIAKRLESKGHSVTIEIPPESKSCDYPEPAYTVASSIVAGKAERGILLCGTGIGMCIASNKVHGIRAAVVHDELTAELSRSHNDANILCLSADLLGQRLIEKIVDTWLNREFEGGRHERRISKIHDIEEGRDPHASIAG